MDLHCERDKSDEIEVTPEMIEAGKEAFWRHVGERDADVAAFAIFSEMVAASPMLKRFRVVELPD